ncbi:MAG: hypothetical protein ACOH5I_06730 [Oligoflexus sp.]
MSWARTLIGVMLVFFTYTPMSFAARVSKVDRGQGVLILDLSRSEMRRVEINQRSYLVDPASRLKLLVIFQRIDGNKAKVSLAKNQKLPRRFRENTRVTLQNPRTKRQTRPSLGSNQIVKTLGSSEKDRYGKSLSFDLELGSVVVPIPSFGVNLGFFVHPNLLFELNYAHGEQSFEADNPIGEDLFFQTTAAVDVVTARFKTYLGNSFYTNAGLGIRNYTLSGNPLFYFEGFDFPQGPIFIQSHADAVFEFSVGNKWQFSYFNMGFDWLGILAPLSKIRLPDDGRSYAIEPSDVLILAGYENVDPALRYQPRQLERLRQTSLYSKFYFGFSF